MKIKVLMITGRSDVGGGPKHVFDLCSILCDKIDLYIASPNELPYFPRYKSLALDTLEIPKRQFSLVALYRLWNFCRKNQIQIIHSHGRAAGVYSRILGVFGFKAVHSFHGLHFQSNLKSRLILIIERILGFWTSAFIAVSRGELERAKDLKIAPPNKLHLIYNGVPQLAIGPNDHAKNPPYKLGCLTRLDPQKGNRTLVEKIYNLPESLKKSIHLEIAGDGEERDLLEADIQKMNLKNTVHLTGVTNQPEEFIRTKDLIVSSSFGEGLSYTTLESLSLGVPLLLSRVTGHTELEGIAGVSFFEIGDSKSFESEIQKFLNAPKMLTSLAVQFRLETMAHRIHELYQQLIKELQRLEKE